MPAKPQEADGEIKAGPSVGRGRAQVPTHRTRVHRAAELGLQGALKVIEDNLAICKGAPGPSPAACVPCGRDWSPGAAAHAFPAEGHRGACLPTGSLTRSLTLGKAVLCVCGGGLARGAGRRDLMYAPISSQTHPPPSPTLLHVRKQSYTWQKSQSGGVGGSGWRGTRGRLRAGHVLLFI